MKKLQLLSAIALAHFSTHAAADVVYDNLGPIDDYDPVTGWVVSDGPPFGNVVEQAMPFTPSTAGGLDTIEFAMTMVGGSAQASITVDLYSDAPGEPLASLVTTSVTTTVAANPASPLAPVITASFPGTPFLNVGETYWVVIANNAPLNGNFLVWNHNLAGDMGSVADRRNGGPAWNVFANQQLAAFRVSTVDTFGTNYCGPAVANSSGQPGTMDVMGSPSVAVNNFTLAASGLPANQFGIFVVAPSQAFVPGAGGTSNGNICLGGSIGRFDQGPQILATGPTGEFALGIDLTMIPQGNGFVAVMPSDTWNFQAWFRDGVGLGSNFTDGIEVAFQ